MEGSDSAEEEALRADVMVEANNDAEEQQFDIALAASHSYMGPSLETGSGRGRARVEAGWEGRVPVMAHHGIVFPGETVPMLFTEDVDILSEAIQQDKLFGLLCPDEGGAALSGYGVLCEVYEVLAAPAGVQRRSPSPPLVSFKARATHRFRCRQLPRRALTAHAFDRLRFMDVRVLPDVRLADPLRAARLAALDPLRAEDERAVRLRRMDAALTPWPLFVYEIFDFRRMRRTIRDYFKTLGIDDVPEDAVTLSHWTASNLALTPRDRLALFVVDDALLRLHMEVGFIMEKSVLCCAACEVEIARREQIFAMSTEGVHSNYINLGGFVHDVVTVSSVRNTRLSGAPSAEYSWFPGYEWTVAVCAMCHAHVGWRYVWTGARAVRRRPSTRGSPATSGPSPCAPCATRTSAGGTCGPAPERCAVGRVLVVPRLRVDRRRVRHVPRARRLEVRVDRRPSGAPSAEYSWFPGYEWTVAVCAMCHAHVGWRYVWTGARAVRRRPSTRGSPATSGPSPCAPCATRTSAGGTCGPAPERCAVGRVLVVPRLRVDRRRVRHVPRARRLEVRVDRRPSGAPSAEYSWFPGYEWTVAVCAMCHAHVGWRFEACRRNLRPQQFYGLCRNAVHPRFSPARAAPPGAQRPPRPPRHHLDPDLLIVEYFVSELGRYAARHAPDRAPDGAPNLAPDLASDHAPDDAPDDSSDHSPPDSPPAQ
ncbi:protein cereblon isoform X2 [Bicyclus anynana]|uniref:Protein cereblon n=1 Tax=Bicyclus anynana TaxID=110368 RepID=A0ABM3M0H7_BICAN|nr:protein cereblon isoform X2 [Bicyclus anynana]